MALVAVAAVVGAIVLAREGVDAAGRIADERADLAQRARRIDFGLQVGGAPRQLGIAGDVELDARLALVAAVGPAVLRADLHAALAPLVQRIAEERRACDRPRRAGR